MIGRMSSLPNAVAKFLSGKRFVVAGVSRSSQQPANAIFRKLHSSGFEAVPVNPKAEQVEGTRCFPDVSSVPGPVDGVIIATHPTVAPEIVRQAHARDIHNLWFHRSFGSGSVSQEALNACSELGIEPIVGGCPLMYCEPVDVAHRCFRWWFGLRGRVPK